MTEGCGQEQQRWTTTVILSTALQDLEISRILQRQQHRVRYSESVETGSVIFPLSGIAFILSDTQDLLGKGEEEIYERIQKFISIHRNSFLVLSAALHGPEEWSVMFRIQRRLCIAWGKREKSSVYHHSLHQMCVQMASIPSIKQINKTKFRPAVIGSNIIETDFHGSRFLGSNLRVIPVHNPAETVKLMLTMAKITAKPQADDTRYKMEMTKTQIIEKSPVWKMLQEYQLHCN